MTQENSRKKESRLIHRKKIVTLDEPALSLHCSKRTVQRRLAKLRPSSFLWNFHSHPEIKRQKHQGRYVYFASEPARYAQQRQNRIMMHQTQRLPSEFEAIAILVEKIKYPQLSLEELADKLKGKNLCIDPEAVENLFLHHGLVIKKNHI